MGVSSHEGREVFITDEEALEMASNSIAGVCKGSEDAKTALKNLYDPNGNLLHPDFRGLGSVIRPIIDLDTAAANN